MRNRISGFVLFVVLAVGAALVPMACGSDDDNTNTDANVDRVNSMTPG